MTNTPFKAASPATRAGATVEVVWLQLPDDAELAATNRTLLSPGERERADRFAFARDRTRYILCRVGLRRLLSARLGIPAAAIAFDTNAYGKPRLANGHGPGDLQFNVSHSGHVAVYALAHGCAVGVDVETIETRVDRDAIARDNFSLAEHAAYAALPPGSRPVAFMNCWTRKEAFIKAIGEGLSYPLRSFDVSLAPGEDARLLRLDAGPGAAGDWALASFEPCPGYVGAVAVECRGSPFRINFARAGNDLLQDA
jgi:4'-phosphopantetheinyl transferase